MKTTTYMACLPIAVLLLATCQKVGQNRGTRLVAIEASNGDDTWRITYRYNNGGQLAEINNYRSLGTRYEMEYHNGRLLQYRTVRIDNNKRLFRDSFSYHAEGQIKGIFHFSVNAGADIPLDIIYEYEYGPSGKIAQRRTYSVDGRKYWRRTKFHWKAGKIVRVAEYSGGKLDHEFFYNYDQKNNYKKDIPIYLKDPLNWQDHNIVNMEGKDYTGVLDILCNPCKTRYTYNFDGYPATVETDGGVRYTLEYE